MWLYLIIFAIPLIAYLRGGKVNRNKTFLKTYTVFLALFVGMSDMFGGYDRYIYGEIFDNIADDITNGWNVFAGHAFLSFEKGYSFLSYLIALVTENRYIFILIITLIIYFNIYKTFERHFENYPFAYLLFLGMSFFFTFTYLRQVLAFSFAWIAIRYLLDNKKILFFVVALIAASLHKSGIVFVLLYFIPIKKWKPNHVTIVLLLCGILGLTGVTGHLYDAVMQSDLTTMQGHDYNTNGAARIAYILEVIFFSWIILKNYNKIDKTRENLIFLNMAWAFCVTLLLFVRSNDGGRIAWYFTMGIIYIMSIIAKKSEITANTKPIVAKLLITVMFVLFFRIYFSWQVVMNLYPYKTFLTNGHREGDPVYQKWEYDAKYDKDKFYRPVFRLLKKDEK